MNRANRGILAKAVVSVLIMTMIMGILPCFAYTAQTADREIYISGVIFKPDRR